MKLSEFHLKLLPYGNSTVHTCLYIINLFGIYSVSINWFVHAVNHQEALRMDSAGMRRGSCLPQGTYKGPVLWEKIDALWGFVMHIRVTV